MEKQITVRPIQKEDNPQIAHVIRTVMTEFGAVGEGYSIEDAEVDDMFGYYPAPMAVYYVLDDGEKVVGGAGIAPLQGGNGKTCELKKMYFLQEARGLGFGKRLAKLLIDDARRIGYKTMYLETALRMETANKMYRSLGFQPLTGAMGCTGHSKCDAYYTLELMPK